MQADERKVASAEPERPLLPEVDSRSKFQQRCIRHDFQVVYVEIPRIKVSLKVAVHAAVVRNGDQHDSAGTRQGEVSAKQIPGIGEVLDHAEAVDEIEGTVRKGGLEYVFASQIGADMARFEESLR